MRAHFPEQRLVIEATKCPAVGNFKGNSTEKLIISYITLREISNTLKRVDTLIQIPTAGHFSPFETVPGSLGAEIFLLSVNNIANL